ncbi:phage portal protein [uncultured Arcobacter sp.]|mgnify:CR=1 FL=1|uniref:phage portal protein n=1 Tax=uncultured Arcobacter sp. TaxID=165434 RepID=UPI0026124682|nr:phage portal protein [uncultured Arcobacter sp.]
MAWYNNFYKNLIGSSSKGTLVAEASKGTMKEFFESNSMGRLSNGYQPQENLDTLLNIFLNDPEVNAAITTRANAIFSTGYTIEGAKTQVERAESKLKKAGFNRKFVKRLVLNYILYMNAFIENVDGKEIHLLEGTQMEIDADKHGEIIKFIQRSQEGETIDFTPDEVTYIAASQVTTRVWGDVYMKSLYRTVTTKNEIEKFMNYLAVSNQYRNVIRVDGMSDDDVTSMLAYNTRAEQDPNMKFVFQGSKDNFDIFPMRDMKESEYFIKELEYLRQKILMQLKVPPILIGVPDNSNRSSGDDQIKAFNMNNKADREVLADSFNNDLFPKLGLGNVTFSWNPIDKRTEKDDIEIAEKLINMGADKKQIEQFLRDSGLNLPKGKLFKEEEKIPDMKTPDESYPSRQRKDGEISENIGTGEDSTTREDQMITRSFNEYPYVSQ